MRYLALYRKYRPKTFDEIYGQKIVVQTLKNVIKNNKLTHSYLFIGPRGTGKTSIAKIFAKTINCENQTNGNSCEKCDNCKSNNNNENIDIIEMDAASNNGVDEIREIKNHVTLLPIKSKYKIYIIDEVHMLTTGAFNALLKTLEEPPKHVIFILATTEPHKIPLTIKSRCQNFEFKPIAPVIIADRLKYICEKENINASDDALTLIAENSNGGMRDAISTLDQINAFSNNNITYDDIILLNGRISENQIIELLNTIVNNDYEKCFKIIDDIENKGKEFTYVCEDICKFLKNILVKYQIKKQNKLIDLLKKENILKIIILFNDCIAQIKNTNDKRIYFDLTILKIFDIYSQNIEFKKLNESNNVFDEKINENNNLINNPKKKLKNKNYSLYEKLMNIRLNNILATANKKSLNIYLNFFEEQKTKVNNLDDLKIINLLSDCHIRAGSQDGVIITIDNENILNELYENYRLIEKMIKCNSNQTYVCIMLDSKWIDKREEYVKKIKNKENIIKIDETSIINKMKQEKNLFEDLIEIGE